VSRKNCWRIITGSKIIIDLSSCRFPSDIHDKLKESFGFPDDYGANWSAFWDYLDDFCGDMESRIDVYVKGIDSMRTDLQAYSKGMIEVMRDAEEKYPLVHFLIEQ